MKAGLDRIAQAMAEQIDRKIVAATLSAGDKVRYYDDIGWHVGVVHQVDEKGERAEIEKPNRKPRQRRRWVDLANVEPLAESARKGEAMSSQDKAVGHTPTPKRTPFRFEPMAHLAENNKLRTEAGLGPKFLPVHEQYFCENNGDWIITDCNGERVAAVAFRGKAKRGQGYNAPDPEGFETAQRIVLAVNSHDELVEALRECMKDSFTAADGMSESGKRSFAAERYRKAEAALAAALAAWKESQ